MISRFLRFIGKGTGYVGKHPQLMMTILLMVVVPASFLISGQQFLTAARENQERLEKDRVGMMHDLFIAFMRAGRFDSNIIQSEILRLAELNPDVVKFRVAIEENDHIRIVAALDAESVGTIADSDAYRIAHLNPNESIIAPYAEQGIRYWQSFRLVRNDDGVNYYVFTQTSLEHIDSLFANRIMTAYYWLVGLLIIVLFLVVRHVRLIDYAYLYQETKRANELKDLFTNMIAHELRTPLTAMRGYASMIRESKGVAVETSIQAKRIEDSAERLVLIVNDLLDVARIQSGKLSITKTPVDISKIIVAVTDELQIIAKAKNIILTYEGVHRDVIVSTDQKRLYQAVMNLVSNAIKYTERGVITVSLDDKNDRVEIRVKDTGMGISAENQKNLFAPFFRVASDEMKNVTGTGLGMWITKQVIELMGGSIGVESIKGVGTHIVITIPKTGVA